MNGMMGEREFFPPSGTWRETPMVSVLLDNEIGFHNPLTITWYYGPTADGPWYEAGQSSNPVYVLLDTPQTAPLYHTLVHLGCENAKGEIDALPSTLPSGEKKLGAIAKIWGEFTDRSVVRVKTNAPMTYWGEWASQDENAVPPEVLDSFFTAAGLLKYGDGRCMAWAELFVDMLNAQGITTASVQGIQIRKAQIQITPDRVVELQGRYLYVKNWEMSLFPNVVPLPGIAAQGNPDPSASYFANHAVVMFSGEPAIYDPSYGKPFLNLMDWEDHSLDFLEYDGSDHQTYYAPNTLGNEQTCIIGSDGCPYQP